MISKAIKNLTTEDIKALFNTEDEFIAKRKNDLEFNRILNGEVTPEEYRYLSRRLDNIVVRDAFEHGSLIKTDTHRAIFPYAPSELVAATNHFSKLNLSVPVLDYNHNGIVVTNTFDFSVNTPEIVQAEVSEELMTDDNIPLFSELLNSQMNILIEDKIIEALNTTQCAANSFVAAVEQLDKKHLRNLTAIVPYSDFIDSPQQYNYNGKINVIPCDCSNVFIGDLKAIISNAYIDSVKYSKDVKNGIYTIIQRVYSLNAVLTDKNAAVAKIV